MKLKISAMPARLKARCKETKTEFNITQDQIEKSLTEAYGEPCPYCGKTLVYKIMQFDHITPVSSGGNTEIDNMQWICKSCNTMKGMLSHESFDKLLSLIASLPEKEAFYITNKMQRGGHFG